MIVKLDVADMKVSGIFEMRFPYIHAQELMPGLTDAALAENRPWLRDFGLEDDDRFTLCIQSFVVETPDKIILVDTCAGNDKIHSMPEFHLRKSDAFLTGLAEAGYAPDDIDMVICTHLHFDHVGWNTLKTDDGWSPTFRNAEYVFGQQDYDFYRQEDARSPSPVFRASVVPVVAAGKARIVDWTSELDPYVRLIPTPGHSAGHMSVAFGRGQDDIVVSGDVILVAMQMKNTALSFFKDNDPDLAARTRAAFFERYCDTETLCCIPHLPMPSIGRITRWDDGYRFVPVDL